MIYLAFYRGEGRFLSDTVVQWITRSDFSHCELFKSEEPPSLGETHTCITAVGKDGGVRIKDVTFTPGRWEIVGVPWAPADTIEKAKSFMGSGYDYLGLAMTQFINLRRHNPARLFCSKLCAIALGLGEGHCYAPGDLKRVVEEHNRVFHLAQLNARAHDPSEVPEKSSGGSGPLGGRIIRIEGESLVADNFSNHGTIFGRERQGQAHIHQARQHPVRPRKALRTRVTPAVVARGEGFGHVSAKPLQLDPARTTPGDKVIRFPGANLG